MKEGEANPKGAKSNMIKGINFESKRIGFKSFFVV
jgi:hypothetical protein